MKHLLPPVLLIVTLIASCALSPQATARPSRTLTVFAAASLIDAFKEIGADFEAAHPGVTVKFNFAGSQTLRAQLEQGAYADVFASANHTEIDTAVTDGLVASGVAKDFLTNILIVILPPQNPAGVESLQDLARPGLKLVLADETVPAGKYSRQVLTNINQDPSYGADYASKVLANVVSSETDVKQVVTKVQLGEADAGIVYLSDSTAAPSLKTIAIPSQFNVVARYPIAPLLASHFPDTANAFVAFVLSSGGQDVLKKWGFSPVNP